MDTFKGKDLSNGLLVALSHMTLVKKHLTWRAKPLARFSLIEVPGKQTRGSIAIDPAKVVAVQTDAHASTVRVFVDGGFSWLVRESYDEAMACIWSGAR